MGQEELQEVDRDHQLVAGSEAADRTAPDPPGSLVDHSQLVDTLLVAAGLVVEWHTVTVEGLPLPAVPCRQRSAAVGAAVKSLQAEPGAVHKLVPGPGPAAHTWQWIQPAGLVERIPEPVAAGRTTELQSVAAADHIPLSVGR